MIRYANTTEIKSNGIIYTPSLMADFLSEELMRLKEHHKQSIKILDPAIGDGELVLALATKLLLQGEVNITIVGFETDKLVALETQVKLENMFPDFDITIINVDFVKFALDGGFAQCAHRFFDYIIANPPYVRTQILGAETSQKLSRQLNLKGRVDLYYAFLVLSTSLLRQDGIAGFITSNKFMTIKSGANIRKHLLKNANIKRIVDFGDTKLFPAAVLPCIVLFQNPSATEKRIPFTSVYESKADDKGVYATNIFIALNQDGTYILPSEKQIRVKNGWLKASEDSEEIWTISSDETTKWLKTVQERTWKEFSQIGKIRVGIKTTADNIFIGDSWSEKSVSGLPELLKPLITHRNAGQIIPQNAKHWEVLYTHEMVNGKKQAIDITKYPRSYDYLSKFKKQLSARSYIKNANRNWYEIWVPQNPASWEKNKIVFRDIASKPEFWYDTSGAIVNGDCYWIDIFDGVCEDIVMLALAVANSTFIEKFYDVKFNNKLYAGKRRYMSQYVEQFPLPDPKNEMAAEVISLVKHIIKKGILDENIKQKIDKLIFDVFLQ